MKTQLEIQTLIDHAKSMNMKSVTIDGVQYEFKDAYQQNKIQITDEDLKELAKQHVEGEFTDEEFLYMSTPYFDELQEKKQRTLQLKKEQIED